MKRLIGCDVDDVIVAPPWKEWIAANPNKDRLDFWRSPTLYDNLEPIQGSVEALRELSKHFDIVFISKLKGQHHSSKVKFVKRNFPFLAGFMGTHEKYLMNNSLVAMIDDKHAMLEGFDLPKRVLYSTPYTQTSECPVNFLIESWEMFSVRAFLEYYYVGQSVEDK